MIELTISDRMEGYLRLLARYGVFGETAEEVATHLLGEGLAQQMRGGGMLREDALKTVPSFEEEEPLEEQVDKEFKQAANFGHDRGR